MGILPVYGLESPWLCLSMHAIANTHEAIHPFLITQYLSLGKMKRKYQEYMRTEEEEKKETITAQKKDTLSNIHLHPISLSRVDSLSGLLDRLQDFVVRERVVCDNGGGLIVQADGVGLHACLFFLSSKQLRR